MLNSVKIMLMIVMVIGLVGTIGAVPPTTTIFGGDTGLKLEVATPIAVPTSTIINVTVHIFNASTGFLLDADDYTCEGALFNPKGILIVRQTAGMEEHFAYFTMNETHATEAGIYPYTFHCNSSDVGGYYTGYFDVTESGVSLNVEDSIVNASFIILLFGIAVFFLIFARTTEEGGVKLFFNVIGYITLLLCVGTSYIFLQGVQTGLLPMNMVAIFLIGIVFIVIMYYIFINLTKTSLAMMRIKKGFGSELDNPATF